MIKIHHIALLSLAIAQAAVADSIWDLNAIFVDGGKAIGVFELNSGYTAFTAWNIVVSPGGPPGYLDPGYDYTAYGSTPPLSHSSKV